MSSLHYLSLAVGLLAKPGSADPMNYLILGDWGGQTDAHPVVQATERLSQGMADAAKSLGGVRFVLSVGDNFYEKGISGDEHSVRFQTGFETPFSHDELQCPWRSIAGNHDHQGNISAQIAFSKHSSRWDFPDFWFTFVERSRDGAVSQFVMIDTEFLFGMAHDEVLFYHPKSFAAQQGPQLNWLKETLAKSTADYLWVVGHYPLYSHCSHGPQDDMASDVLPLLEYYGATGVIAGHDHCLGHFTTDKMAFVNSGAGRSVGGDPKHLHDPENKGRLHFRMDEGKTHGAEAGFASASVTKTETIFRYHDETGKVLFTSPPVKPRKGHKLPTDVPEPSIISNCRRRRQCVNQAPKTIV